MLMFAFYKKHLNAKKIVLLGVFTTFAPGSFADKSHADKNKSEVSEEVTVIGSKIPKKTLELTHSVTVVNEIQIENQAFTDVTEILRQQVGLEFKQTGGPGQFNYLKLRGLSSRNVLIVLDGVKINKPSSGDTGNLLSQLDPKSIERIEILRGPQATLYGANNSAGVIVIITKSGHSSSARVGAEVGSLSWRKAHGSLRNSTAIGSGELAYSLNASNTDSDNTYEYEYFEDTTLQGKLSYEHEVFSLGVNALSVDNAFGYAELDENSSDLDSRAEHWAFQTPDPEQFSETTQQVYSFFAEHYLTEALSQKLQISQTKNTYSINDPDNGLLGLQTANVGGIVVERDVDGNIINESVTGDALYIYDRRWPGIALSPLDLSDPANAIGDIKADYEDQTDQFNYDLLYDGELFSLITGLEHLKQAANQRGSYGEADNEDSQTSFYVNGDLKLLDSALIFALGARYDDYESWGEQATGNVGISWQITGRTSFYANAGTSYTPATLSQLFNPTYGDSSLTPEEGTTFEVGLRQSALDDYLALEATYWNTQIDNVIFYDFSVPNDRAFSGFGQYNNGAEARSSGLELQASYQLSDTLSVDGNYTYTDSETRAVDADWQRTVQIAKNKGNLGLGYDIGVYNIGLNAYYSGPRLRWKGDIEMKEYVRLDLSSRYRFDNGLALSMRIENLLDETIEEGLGYQEPGLYAIVGFDYNF